MSKIINIADYRKPPPDQHTWVGDLSFFLDEEGDPFAVIRDFNDDVAETVADRYRELSRVLYRAAWLAAKMGHQEEPDEDGDLLAVAWVFESSKTRTQVDDEKFITSEQMAWLDERFDDAKVASHP